MPKKPPLDARCSPWPWRQELGSDGFSVEMWPDFADQPIVETWATYQEMGNEP